MRCCLTRCFTLAAGAERQCKDCDGDESCHDQEWLRGPCQRFRKSKRSFLTLHHGVKGARWLDDTTGGKLTFRYCMRTFGYSLGALALAISLGAPSPAAAQRNGRRSLHRSSAPPPAASTVSSTVQPCSTDCGDYSLAVVSALLPVENPGSASSDVVTLVIENKGTAAAPVSFISVAPKNRLVAARRSIVPALAPGERTTIRLPVESGPDGTKCISITISPAPPQDPATAQFLASAIPSLSVEGGLLPSLMDWSAPPELPYWPDLPVELFAPSGKSYANLDEILPFYAYGAF